MVAIAGVHCDGILFRVHGAFIVLGQSRNVHFLSRFKEATIQWKFGIYHTPSRNTPDPPDIARKDKHKALSTSTSLCSQGRDLKGSTEGLAELGLVNLEATIKDDGMRHCWMMEVCVVMEGRTIVG